MKARLTVVRFDNPIQIQSAFGTADEIDSPPALHYDLTFFAPVARLTPGPNPLSF